MQWIHRALARLFDGSAAARWRAHGAWAPGVRLMRALSMRGKMMVIAATLALPISLFAAAEIRGFRAARPAAEAAVQSARQLLLAVELQRAAMQLADSLFSNDPSAMSARRAEEAKAFGNLAASLRDSRAGLTPASAVLAALQPVRQAALDGAGHPDSSVRRVAMLRYLDEIEVMQERLSDNVRLLADFESGRIVDAEFDGVRVGQLTLRLEALLSVVAQPGSDADAIAHRGAARAALDAFLATGSSRAADRPAWHDADPPLERLTQAARQIAADPAEALPDAGRAVLDDTRRALAALVDIRARGADAVVRALAPLPGELERSLLGDMLVPAASLLLTFYFMVCAYRVLSSGQAQLGALIARLGRGDLSPPPKALGRDEIGKAMGMLGEAVASLRGLLDAVTQGVSAVSHASREVARGNGGLSARTGEMRQAIGSVAGSAQSSAVSMDACVEAVAHAREYTLSARQHARSSSKAMTALAERMGALERRSGEINDIVSTLESLAFQTKLLSLNALVEAARAGTSGKGFSVVAQEVRALAGRSENATEQIRSILEDSVRAIEDGTRLAGTAGEAVRGTEADVQAVDGLMESVVGLTRDGMGESQAVLGIARKVEFSVAGNVQLIDQLSDAAAALREQGETLRKSIENFVLV